MMTPRLRRTFACWIATLAAVPALSATDTEAPPEARIYDAQSAFEHLKTMHGTWTGTVVDPSGQERETSIVWKTTAGGHSVIQTFSPGKPYEMFSVYHMDGDELLMTHYCAIGNAPKMKFRATEKAGEIAFEFAGGTNFDPDVDAHAHEGSTQILSGNEVTSQSIGYREGEPGPPRLFHMKREE